MEQYRLLRLKEVERRTGLKKTQIYSLMKMKDFPTSIKIGKTSVAWLEQEINDWIVSKLANR
ncbi:AlpA family phage regulatory protein [Salmonella enterica]|nr:AlpA family phage regulatory protein [Salmonella enterica]EAX6603600.1 AlpA family phage regulatory protein [Salmonella enterica]